MNLNNKKISTYYNIFTFLFLLVGILYIYLGEISMGFARDLAYREYFIIENILIVVNKHVLALIWFLPLFYTLFKKGKDYSFSYIVNIVTFLFLIVATYLFIDEYIILLAVFNIFAFLRLFYL